MYKTTIIGLLLLIGIGCTTTKTIDSIQEDAIEIWTKQSKVDQVIEYEKSLSSDYEILEKNVSLSKSVFPNLGVYKIGNPFIVKRKQTGFLPVYSEYFFSKEDRILRYVSYDWERERFGNYFKKQEIWKEESTKLDGYNKEYERLKTALIKEFGNPKSQDVEPQITKSSSGGKDYLSRNTVWETDESNIKLNMIFASTTYRIRLNYYWK